MTSELDFVAALDAEPGNHWLRQVYADFLEENGSELASGMRALGRCGLSPWWFDYSECWGWWRQGTPNLSLAVLQSGSVLPESWFLAITPSRHVILATRRDANSLLHTPDHDPHYGPRHLCKAAAIAWLRLTDAERAKIMADAGVTV